MTRKIIERQSEFPYHIYNRVLSQKHYPPALQKLIWSIYCEELRVVSWAFGFRIHLFLMMSNHYHMVVETPDANISEGMLYFQREVSKRIKDLTRSQDYRFQTRYKWKAIQNMIQYENTYRYIAHNPRKAGLCTDPLDYTYCTLHGQFGGGVLECPIYEWSRFSALLPVCMNERAEWIRCQV